jgi:hypothetical protein
MSRRSENGAEFSTPYAFCSLLAGSYKWKDLNMSGAVLGHMGTAYLLTEPNYWPEMVGHLNHLKETAQSPSDLEVTIAETAKIDGLPYNIVSIALERGLLTAVKGTHPTMQNRRVASEMGDFGNAAYLAFQEAGEPYRGEIVYEENGRWLTQD